MSDVLDSETHQVAKRMQISVTKIKSPAKASKEAQSNPSESVAEDATDK